MLNLKRGKQMGDKRRELVVKSLFLNSNANYHVFYLKSYPKTGKVDIEKIGYMFIVDYEDFSY